MNKELIVNKTFAIGKSVSLADTVAVTIEELRAEALSDLFDQTYAKLQTMKKVGRVPRADFSDFPGRMEVIPMLVSVIYR